MAKRYYEPVAGDLQLWTDPNLFVRADLEDELDAIEEIIALSDDAKEHLLGGGVGGLEEYDESLLLMRERLKNLIDFFDYDNKVINLNTKDGAWFTPIAVQSFCGEEAGQEVGLTIDGQNNTYWEHLVNEEHSVVWQLRDYKKRILKLRVRMGGSSRNRLTDVDIYIANTLDGLDNENNRVATGVDLTLVDAWEEITWSGSKNGRYIMFAGFGADNANNYVRIQEIQAWVMTIEYD